MGAAICAMLQAIAYIAAYCPRLAGIVRLIQKEFMKGMANISPSVITIIENTAVHAEGGRTLSTAYAMPISSTPVRIKVVNGLEPSSEYTNIISIATMIKPL